MPKRRTNSASAKGFGLGVRYATSEAVTGWESVCSAAPANARVAWDKITEDPRARSERQHPLRGQLATRSVNGSALEQWRYEVTAGGCLWYCIDDAIQTVWLTDATVGHPKATE